MNNVVGNKNITYIYFLSSPIMELRTIHSPQSIVVMLLGYEENIQRKQYRSHYRL